MRLFFASICLPIAVTGASSSQIGIARGSVALLVRPAVVAFGDSITWGSNASINSLPAYMRSIRPLAEHVPGSRDTTYPAYLQRSRFAKIVYNYGLPGETVEQGLPRLRRLVRQLRPKLVLLMEGVNDELGAHPTPGRRVHRALKSMVQVMKQYRVRPVLLTLTPTYFPASDPRRPTNGRVRRLNRFIRTLANQSRVTLVDVEKAFLADPAGASLTRQSNGQLNYVHPNDDGYRLIAATVIARLKATRLLSHLGSF